MVMDWDEFLEVDRVCGARTGGMSGSEFDATKETDIRPTRKMKTTMATEAIFMVVAAAAAPGLRWVLRRRVFEGVEDDWSDGFRPPLSRSFDRVARLALARSPILRLGRSSFGLNMSGGNPGGYGFGQCAYVRIVKLSV